ncbi:hypothetical protein VCHENC02_3060A, partial [Vibrio harveyi]
MFAKQSSQITLFFRTYSTKIS